MATKYVTSKENIGALIDEVKKTNEMLGEDQAIMDVDSYTLKLINNHMADMSAGISAIHEQMSGDKLKQMEADKERQDYMEKLLAGIKNKDDKKPDAKKSGDFSWLGLAAALVTGLVAGGLAFIKNYVQGIMNSLKAITKLLNIDSVIAKLWQPLVKGFQYIDDLMKGGFSKVFNVVKNLFDFGEKGLFHSLKGGLLKVFTFLGELFGFSGKGMFKDVMRLFESVGEMIRGIFKPIAALFKDGGGFLSKMLGGLEFFSPIVKFFKAFGSILGKLAWPIQVIMSLWDTISGALDGWNKTEGDFLAKFFGAIKGGLTGLLNGLVGGLLDLLKDGLSWILEALGFDKAAKILDSFSFSKLIEDVVGGFYDMVEGMVRYVIDLFQKGPAQALEKIGNVMSNIADAAKNVLKSLLRSILPNPQGSMMEKIASKAIPDAVYEFAGINPKTGKSTDAVEPPKAAETPPATQQVVKATESKAASEAPVTAKQIEAPAPSPVTPEMRAQILSQPMRTTLPPAQEENTAVKQEGEMTRGEANVKAMQEGRRPSFDRARPSKESMGGGNTAVISSGTTKWDPEDMMARGVTP
jgi:hypothetical protein